jgi:hypothetical protein
MSTSTAVCPVTVDYAARSELRSGDAGATLALALDQGRAAVGVRGRVREPAMFRDALATAAAILASDLRYKGRDRTAYLAYLAKKGKKATAAIWEAHKAFLDQALAGETQKQTVLDPLLTVHPDEVSLEVFSRDESSYARLAFRSELFEDRQVAHGTTFVDLPPTLVESLDRLRTHTPLALDAGAARTGGAGAAAGGEKRALEVPYAWIRGFLQVQSAATLPSVACELGAIDLYNLLFALRTRKAKKPPRGLRFELVPGVAPRLVVEPWEIVLEGHAGVYTGPAPRVVRTFGRQRLMALARLLPYARRVRVQLLGPGLPVFWVLDLGHATLTMALTGWTESGWASAAAFDALMPGAGARTLAEKVYALLDRDGPQPLPAIQRATGASAADARAALQLLCLRGQVLYDLAREVYRPRALLAAPVDESLIRYGSEREARAHRLLGDGAAAHGEVKLTKVHEIAGEGTEIHGEVVDKEAHRSFAPRFTIDLEGRTSDAWCSCSHYRRAGMREGPCEHMLALRLAYARRRADEEALRQTPEGRKLIRAETRTYVRREPTGGETVYRVSLDGRGVHVRWGRRADEPRQQRVWFDTDAEARDAYFGKVEGLLADGFIDSDASVA